MTVPHGFELAAVASPGDVVILRVKRAIVNPAHRARIADELLEAADRFGVRFVLLDEDYFEIAKPDKPEADR